MQKPAQPCDGSPKRKNLRIERPQKTYTFKPEESTQTKPQTLRNPQKTKPTTLNTLNALLCFLSAWIPELRTPQLVLLCSLAEDVGGMVRYHPGHEGLL